MEQLIKSLKYNIAKFKAKVNDAEMYLDFDKAQKNSEIVEKLEIELLEAQTRLFLKNKDENSLLKLGFNMEEIKSMMRDEDV